MLNKLNFSFEGQVNGDDLDIHARNNRGRGPHQRILEFKRVAEDKFLVVSEDRIALHAYKAGASPEEGSEIRVVVQYERDADKDYISWEGQTLWRKPKT